MRELFFLGCGCKDIANHSTGYCNVFAQEVKKRHAHAHYSSIATATIIMSVTLQVLSSSGNSSNVQVSCLQLVPIRPASHFYPRVTHCTMFDRLLPLDIRCEGH